MVQISQKIGSEHSFNVRYQFQKSPGETKYHSFDVGLVPKPREFRFAEGCYLGHKVMPFDFGRPHDFILPNHNVIQVCSVWGEWSVYTSHRTDGRDSLSATTIEGPYSSSTPCF